MDVSLDVREPTWARFEAACEALSSDAGEPLHPDDVLDAAAPPAVDAATAPAVLGVLVAGGVPEAMDDAHAARLAWRTFFYEARTQAARAGARTKRYADRCAVWGVMTAQSAGEKSLSRVLAGFRPEEHQALRHMPLEELLAYFGLRSVDHVSSHLKDYL